MIRGNNTNNFAEAGVRVQKDAIFERARAYNPAQLFDMLSSRLDSYYSRRLQDIANGKHGDFTLSPRFLAHKKASIPYKDITCVGESTFEQGARAKAALRRGALRERSVRRAKYYLLPRDPGRHLTISQRMWLLMRRLARIKAQSGT